MKKISRMSLWIGLLMLLLVGCEDRQLPFEPNSEKTVNESLGKREFEDFEFSISKRADKFIVQAQTKINQANEKYNKALAKVEESELVDVFAKIGLADSALAAAKLKRDAGEYGNAVALAREAKALASEALDMLEDILDAVEDDGGCNEEQAAKFMEQAQEKIDKAQDKVAAVTEPVDLTEVELKILAAENSLALAQIAFDAADYPEACAKAKAAKELASEALDMLEDILDDENGGGNSNSMEQADKFMAQAQAKIDKAQEKADKKDSPDVDLATMYNKIQEARDKLLEAQDAYYIPDYGTAIDLAKEAKELASKALDLLEEILEADDD